MLSTSTPNSYMAIVVPTLLMGFISIGLTMGIAGLTQVFLPINVGVSKQTINIITNLTSCVGSIFAVIFTGHVFTRFITDNRYKLFCFLSLNVFASGCCIFSYPWINSFPLFLFTYLCATVTRVNFKVAGHSLMFIMLGPVRSRSFIQLVEAFLACGPVLGPFLVSPFLPTTSSNSCSDLPSIEEKEKASLEWPFLIVVISHAAAAFFMLLNVFNGLTMPVSDEQVDPCMIDKKYHIYRYRIGVALAFIFYIFSCGMEAFFIFPCHTVEHSGPFGLILSIAPELQKTYFICFLVGRFCAVIISKYVHPSIIIMVSVAACFLGVILIISIGDWSKEGLFAGIIIVGFSLSVQYASKYSWLAEIIDMTGSNSIIVFAGASLGLMMTPSIAGALQAYAGTIALYYLMLGFVIIQGITSLGLLILTRLKWGPSIFS